MAIRTMSAITPPTLPPAIAPTFGLADARCPDEWPEVGVSGTGLVAVRGGT
jgi:hypothetical protein